MKRPAPRARKKSAPPAWDDEGRLLRRIESRLFHAEDREEGEDDGDAVSERTVSAALDPDGTLTVSSFERDLSPRMHGDDDAEEIRRRLTVPDHAVARLAYELVRERFGNEWRGDEDFAAFCAERDIPFDDDES